MSQRIIRENSVRMSSKTLLFLLVLFVISLLVLEVSEAEVFHTEEEDIAITSRSYAPIKDGMGMSGKGYHRRKKRTDKGTTFDEGSNGNQLKIEIFAVATDILNENFLMFNVSAQKSGLSIHLLGEGDAEMREVPLTDNEKLNRNTRNLPFHSRANFGRKILHFHKALLKIEDVNTLVVLVDAYDSIFLSSHPQDLIVAFERARHYAHRLRVRYSERSEDAKSDDAKLLDRYRQFPRIIASAEKNCWPDKSKSHQYPSYSMGHVMRYLNSGVVAGTVGAFLQLFSLLPYTGNEPSDQRYWVAALLASRNETALPIIDVDYQNHLVASISKTSWDLLVMTESKTTASGKFGGVEQPKRGVGVRNLMGNPKILHLPNNKDKLKFCFENLVPQSSSAYVRTDSM